jgi:SOS-response transcriptional repressor LexA
MGTSAVLATAANLDPNALFIRVVGHSMDNVLGDGWLIRADTTRVHPQGGEIVVVEIEGQARILGYWSGGDSPALLKENSAFPAIDLAGKTWRVLGVVTTIVDRPITPRRRPQ